MAHVDLPQELKSGEIHVHEPVSEEEFQTLLAAFSILLKIEQRILAEASNDLQGDSKSKLVALDPEKK
jgi:hypothetical protein